MTTADSIVGREDRELDVFVSYAKENGRFARRLTDELGTHGVRVWLDQLDLKPGEGLAETILAAMKSARYAVVVLSHAYFARRERFCLTELKTLLKLKRGFVVPVWHGVSADFIERAHLEIGNLVAIESRIGAVGVADRIRGRLNDDPRNPAWALCRLPAQSDYWSEAVRLDSLELTRAVRQYREASRAVEGATDLIDRSGSLRDLYDMGGLRRLATIAPQQSTANRVRLLDRAIEWMTCQPLAGGRRHRALLLVGALAVAEPRYPWGRNSQIRRWLDSETQIGLGWHWLLAFAMLFADADTSAAVASRLRSEMDRSHRPPRTLDQIEHSVLNLGEGIRTAAVAAWQQKLLKRLDCTRMLLCLSFIDFSYFERLAQATKRPLEHQLRLLLAFSSCLVIAKAISPRDALAQPVQCARRLATQSQQRITDRAIRSVCAIVRRTATTETDPWDLEPTYLHTIDEWCKPRRATGLAGMLFPFFRVMITRREEFSGEGWESWLQTLRTSAATASCAEIRQLLFEAENLRSAPVSASPR